MATQIPEIKKFLKSDFFQSQNANRSSDIEVELVELKAKPTEFVITNQNSLENIVNTQKQLSEVKESLGCIIDTMSQHPSLFTRTSNYFGSMELWQKIGIGLLLPLPTLAIGLFAHIGVLLIISGAIVVTYSAAGIILDDHHSCNVDIAERLKAGIFSLADVLELVIDALDAIRIRMAEEIEKFKAENFKLESHVINLGVEVATLGSQVQCLRETEKNLRQTKEDLEQTSLNLKENQELLVQVTNDHKKSQIQLSEKIEELNKVKSNLEKQLTNMAGLLQGLTEQYAGIITSEEKHQAFVGKLDDFLNNQADSFDKIADRICNAERELSLVKQELITVKNNLERCLHEQRAMMLEQNKQLDRLEALPNAKGNYSSRKLPPNAKSGIGQFFTKNFFAEKVSDIQSAQVQVLSEDSTVFLGSPGY